MTRLLLIALLTSLAGPALAAPPVYESLALEDCALGSSASTQRAFYTPTAWQAFASRAALPAFAEQPDWSRERVLLLSLGSRPGPGYRLSLQTARVQSGQLELVITEQTPPANALPHPPGTHPCLLLRVQNSGWQQLRLLDGLGRPLTPR